MSLFKGRTRNRWKTKLAGGDSALTIGLLRTAERGKKEPLAIAAGAHGKKKKKKKKKKKSSWQSPSAAVRQRGLKKPKGKTCN